MNVRPGSTHRWLGALALAGAVAMLVAGGTVLEGRLGPIQFALYWATCFLLTATAIAIAFADVRATASRTAREQRELFEATLQKIQDEATHKRKRDRVKGNGA